MSKALCVKKSDLFRVDVDQSEQDIYVQNPKNLFDLKPTLQDRSTCETDPTLLQIIPYVTIFDKHTNDIFVYRRGQASGEKRLSGKCSLGLGGHMEIEPTADKTLVQLIAFEAIRELQEQVGLNLTTELMEQILGKLSGNNCSVMYSNRTEVDRVHLAVSVFLGLDKADLGAMEKGVITRGTWMSFDDLQTSMQEQLFELENWSRMVLMSYQFTMK